jgi:epoxyqueuosine reductase
MEETIRRLHAEGCFDNDFYDRYLAKYLDFNPPATLPEAKSMVILSSFSPTTVVRFGQKEVVIPPTYVYREFWEGSLKLLTELLSPAGYHIARARLPLKTLAVRSGLGWFGRNNICYVPGLGSYHRLGAFFTDIQPEDDTWQAPRLMPACRCCQKCLEACPTGSLSPGRFLVEAGRCLTYRNEIEPAFPDWIIPEWHNAVFGCLRCQQTCPVNIKMIKLSKLSSLAFTEAEANSILHNTPLAELGPETRVKLHELCLDDDYNLLARNLAVLVNR